MPLIDDDTLRTDRKPHSWWPWVLVAAGAGLLWLIFALAVSYVPRAISNTPSSTSGLQARQSIIIREAEKMVSFGMAQQAVANLAAIDPAVPMSLSDKHTYLRVSAKAHSATGNPLAASQYYDRYLSFGLSIHSAECRSCHSAASGIAPTRFRDLMQSELGTQYVAELTAAGKVRATRNRLKAALKANPEDARAHLLLFHIARVREEKAASNRHAQAFRALEEAAEGGSTGDN